MNHVVAYKLLIGELDAYRALGIETLRQLVGERISHRKLAEDGIEYEVSIAVGWRYNEGGDIRVTGFVGEIAWNGPHDSLDDTFVVSQPSIVNS